MSFKKLLLSSFITVGALATGLNINYTSKDIITLKKQKNSYFLEIANSRVERTNMKVRITHQDGKTESYAVKVDRDDKRRRSELLELKLNKKQALIGLKRLGKFNIPLKNGRVLVPRKVAQKIMTSSLERDMNHLVKNLDKNIVLSNVVTKVRSVDMSCKNRSKGYIVCTTKSKVESKIKSDNKSNISALVGHLMDLKKEMKENIAVKYDMDGYREFLDKSELLLKKTLNTVKSKRITRKLIETKQLIIDERIESYEYTAIRAKSIITFVDKVLKGLGQLS